MCMINDNPTALLYILDSTSLKLLKKLSERFFRSEDNISIFRSIYSGVNQKRINSGGFTIHLKNKLKSFISS